MLITRLDVPQCSVGEGPLWDVQSQRLHWIDILARAVHCLKPVSGQTQRWSVPNIIGSMAISQDGNAIVALANRVHRLDFTTGDCDLLATSQDLNEQT